MIKHAQPKILLLWDRMGDYHRARWKALQQQIGTENCYAADLGAGDGLYHWENTGDHAHYFRLSELPVDQVKSNEALQRFKQIIKEHQITHVCIPGYGRTVYINMLLWCRFNGIRVLMFAESWYPGNGLIDRLKGMLVRFTTDICLVSGKRAAEHFIGRLKYPSSRIVEGYSVVDNQHFASAMTTSKVAPPQLLCVARFAPEKNLQILIEAFQASRLTNTWQLRLVGGGPLKQELEKSIHTPNIKLDNWLSYDQLPTMYAEASFFILPSRFEPWGLVVNEAMAAGLPVILSDAVGALPDLLNEGINGWQFQALDKESLIEVLNRLANEPLESLEQKGKKSGEIIHCFSPDTWANSVSEWIRKRKN